MKSSAALWLLPIRWAIRVLCNRRKADKGNKKVNIFQFLGVFPFIHLGGLCFFFLKKCQQWNVFVTNSLGFFLISLSFRPVNCTCKKRERPCLHVNQARVLALHSEPENTCTVTILKMLISFSFCGGFPVWWILVSSVCFPSCWYSRGNFTKNSKNATVSWFL